MLEVSRIGHHRIATLSANIAGELDCTLIEEHNSCSLMVSSEFKTHKIITTTAY